MVYMKLALIHAMTASVKPIEEAFREVAPNVTLLHFMDTGLLPLIKEHGKLTPPIVRRFSRLVNLAAESEVNAIQLTCSAFNNVTKMLQPLHSARLFRSDEAMLDEALAYERIGLISTVKETPVALHSYLLEKKPNIHVESLVGTDAIRLLYQGKKRDHDELVQGMIREMDGRVDVIVLSQYSMAHVAQQVEASIPILTGPSATAKRCLHYLQSLSRGTE
jgi:signal transduction histidine kinase